MPSTTPVEHQIFSECTQAINDIADILESIEAKEVNTTHLRSLIAEYHQAYDKICAQHEDILSGRKFLTLLELQLHQASINHLRATIRFLERGL